MKIKLVLLSLLLGAMGILIDNSHRLPTTVIPLEYHVTIDTSLNKPFKGGFVSILVEVKNETKAIILHQVELEIGNVHVSNNLTTINVTGTSYNKQLQQYTLHFAENLKTQTYRINISYTAKTNSSSWTNGYFINNYNELYTYPTHVALTQFTAIDARKFFPCFDEPHLKANFTISLIRSERYTTISNMPLKESVRVDNCAIRDTFHTTPKISTYVVTFAICNFPYLPYSLGRIYIRPPYIRLATHIVEIVEKILYEMTQLLNMSVPMAQLNMIAVNPLIREVSDNWGLVVFSEQDTVYEKITNSRKNMHNSYSMLAHGIAHQWFGSLVTPNWWNSLWLSEGIVEILHIKTIHKLQPSWRFNEQMVLSMLINGVEIDVSANAKALSYEPNLMSKYEHYFTDLNRKKAAAVIRTLENMIGEEALTEGLKSYLLKHQYSTATAEDLWNFIWDYIPKHHFNIYQLLYAAHKHLAIIMDSWENNVGIPILNILRHDERTYILAKQERYITDKSYQDPTLWFIPINYATKSSPKFTDLKATEWISNQQGHVWFANLSSAEWVIVNKEASYYYLVNYDKNNWKLLASALDTENHDKIPPLTRAKLLFDAFTLARSGYLNYTAALDLIKYLKRERDYIALKSFFYVFEFFYNRFSEIDDFHYIQKFVADALQPTLEYLDVKENKTLPVDDQHIDSLNRVQVIKWACRLGNKLCRNLVEQRLQYIDTVSADLKEVIICESIRKSKSNLWNELFEKSLRNNDSIMFESLGCSEVTSNLYTFMNKRLGQNISDFDKVFTTGSFGVNYVLEFLMQFWSSIAVEVLWPDKWAELFLNISEYITTEKQLVKLRHIAAHKLAYRIKELDRALNIAIKQAQENVNLVERYSKDVTIWIKNELAGGSSVQMSSHLFAVLLIIASFYRFYF